MTRTLRLAPIAAAALTLLAATGRPAASQDRATATRPARWAFHITTGSMMPVGELHDALRSAPLTAAQLSWLATPRLAVIGTFGWARSRDLVAPGAPKVDALTADIGAELRSEMRPIGASSGIGGFIGSGLGMRRYDSRAANTDASRHLTAYAAVGADIAVRRVGLRIELRDYVGGFTPIAGSGARTVANDIVVMNTLRIHRRRPLAR